MTQVTIDLLRVTQIATVAGFVALALFALVRARRFGPSGWWAAAAFAVLASSLCAVWLPGWFGFTPVEWLGDVGLVLLLAFPYLLLRFTATFRAFPRAVEVAAAAAALLAMFVVLVPLDGPDDPGPVLATVYLTGALTYWALVSLMTAARLWGAGRGQPGVARRRMRLMAVATAVLTFALLVLIELGDRSPAAEVLAHLCALLSAVVFGLGFSPPPPLRLSWRQREDERLVTATQALLQAERRDEVAEHLLLPTIRIMGARGAALLDADDRVIASEGVAPEPGERLEHVRVTTNGSTRAVADLGSSQGKLVAWTGPYTPFFGPEELGLLQTMAAIGGLALQRCTLLAEERAQHVAMREAQRQSEAARIEAEKARRDAHEANQAKSDFLSRMSHELRTPLNAILGFSQLMETSDLSEEDREAVGHILKAGRHLLALITDVLDLSRIEAGKLTVSLEPVHAAELIDDSVALIRPLARARSISIEVDDSACDAYVRTDRQRCRQALLNLLSNAVKYNRDNGTVEVRCERRDRDTLRIAVRDTGPGIDRERQRKLFEPFERLGAEGSTVEGTGLGLALTKQLAERLGGSIGLHSEPREGSTFWIDLPVTSASSPPEQLTVPAGGAAPGRERQLLLVEDNLANLRLVETMLRLRPGTSVLPAMQGTLALELAYQHRPDVIVLDLHLPDLTGRDVLARLKADPRTRDIPVVVASADATPGRIRQLREEGAFDYITKPLDLQRFLEVIDAALDADSR